MRVLVAGASGAIVSRLVPQLIKAGHEVIGTYTSPGGHECVWDLGATPVALDPGAVREAVREAANPPGKAGLTPKGVDRHDPLA
jgi:2-alkyl-3-oxoalkanoate reductase